jgi:periplasmic protein TonB
MKFCPKCQTKYDDAILRFCKIDGTPLISETPPNFTAMPSQSSINIDDELGEETIISRKHQDKTASLPQQSLDEDEPRQRIVVQTSTPELKQTTPQKGFQTNQPKKSSTAATMFLTLFGTLGVLGGGFGVWWFLSGNNSNTANVNKPANVNQNANLAALNGNVVQNMNVDNTNNFNYNANYGNVNVNSNANFNTNFNTNINPSNLKTPTPTPTPKPTPKPTIKPANVNANVKSNTNTTSNVNAMVNTNVNAKPIPTNANVNVPKPPTPKPPANMPPKNVSVGNLTSRAVSLPKPAYPPIAKQAGANGQVVVQITVDENGNVLSAKAVNGNLLLRSPAEIAAKQAKFPSNIGGENAKAVGTLIYNFVN